MRVPQVLCAHPPLARRHEAAVSFRKAIAIARQQGARTFERKARANLEILAHGDLPRGPDL
jgi:hypothetical protein